MAILMTSLWILYSLTEGIVEGFTFHKARLADSYNNSWLGMDIHKWFTLRRSIVLSCMVVVAYYDIGCYCLVMAIGNSMMFPFLHDGSMYYSRNKRMSTVYPEGFWHDPTGRSDHKFHSSSDRWAGCFRSRWSNLYHSQRIQSGR